MSHALYIMACCNGKNWFKYVTALSNSSLRICSCRFLSLFYKMRSIHRLYVGKRPLTVHEREKNGCLFDLNCWAFSWKSKASKISDLSIASLTYRYFADFPTLFTLTQERVLLTMWVLFRGNAVTCFADFPRKYITHLNKIKNDHRRTKPSKKLVKMLPSGRAEWICTINLK